jgi:hypothetical protein
MTPEELGRLFHRCTSSAFRLECLPAYDVTEDAERDAYRRWLAGEQLPPPQRAWPELVASAVAAGKRMQRVRVIRQMTDYIRFEMQWGYPANVTAGEDIRILDLGPEGEALPTQHDFWLFDDAIAVRLDYGSDGRFVGPIEVSDATTYRRTRDLVLRRAVPFAKYRASLPT